MTYYFIFFAGFALIALLIILEKILGVLRDISLLIAKLKDREITEFLNELRDSTKCNETKYSIDDFLN